MGTLVAYVKIVAKFLTNSALSTIRKLCSTVDSIVEHIERKDQEEKQEKLEKEIDEVADRGSLDDLLDLGNGEKN